MKKLYIGLVSLIALTTVSCDDKHEGTFFAGTSETEISFLQKVASITYLPADEGTGIDVVLVRNSADAAFTTEIVVTPGDDYGTLFTYPAEVTFEKGSYAANASFSYDLEDLTLGTTYAFEIGLPEGATAPVDGGRYTSTELMIMRDYEWKVWKAVTVTDEGWFEDPVYINVNMEKAEGADNLYRIPSYYDDGYDLRISFDPTGATNSITFVNGAVQQSGAVWVNTGGAYGDYGAIYAEIDPDTEHSYFDVANNTLVINQRYRVGAGGLTDWYDVTITWKNE